MHECLFKENGSKEGLTSPTLTLARLPASHYTHKNIYPLKGQDSHVATTYILKTLGSYKHELLRCLKKIS